MRLGEGSSRAKIDRARRDDAGSVDPQTRRRLHQAKLHRVPVETGEVGKATQAHRPLAAPAIGLHVVGEHRIGQHRDVAEDIVEDVGLLQVVQLMRLADELAGREAAIGQVIEEHIVGHQARHGDHAPTGQALELLVDAIEVRNARAVQVQRVEAAHERVAGAAMQHVGLALI